VPAAGEHSQFDELEAQQRRAFNVPSGGNNMKLPRRQFLHLAAGAGAMLPLSRFGISRSAWAQAYPTRPVRVMVGFPPGGVTDIVGRLVGQWLSERFGQPFVIENRPGAAGNIATESVVNAAPDGHTLLMVSPAHTVNATLYDKLNFNFIRDIAPVAGIMRVPNVLEINPSLPVTTVPEFIAYVKANPGKINMASGGNGSSQHVSGELFNMMTGTTMVHVPYRGSTPALTDLVGGQVQVMFDTLPSSIELIRAGKLRALAVTTATRSEALPGTPSLAEFIPGYEASALSGIAAPRNTPVDIIDKLNQAINAALADSKNKTRLAEQGGTVFSGSPADFGKLIAEETEKWGKVVKFAGIKPG
jgi:tripartite-type tricarboxylate transporter receptor subunit TctC